MNRELPEWRTARNHILETLDVAAAMAHMPGLCDRETALVALHKARYDCMDIADELRHESAAWLRERGYGALDRPLLPEGELPK